MLRSRYNQILLRFAFWEFKKQREAGHMYEMRSYVLKVVTTQSYFTNLRGMARWQSIMGQGLL